MVLDSRSRTDSSESINSNGANPSSNGNYAIVEPINLPVAPIKKKKSIGRWWQALGLRTKTTVISVAAITIPLLALGGFTYYYVGQNIETTTRQTQSTLATDMSYRVAYFMRDRYSEIQTLAQLSFLNNPKVQAITTPQERQAILTEYLKSNTIYNSIGVFDLNGDVIAQSEGTSLGNHKDRVYFQEVLKTNLAVVSQPEVSKSTGKVVIHLAAPIKDVTTGKTIGIIRARMPVENLDKLVADFAVNGEHYHLAESDGKYFAALEKEQIGREAKEDFPNLAPALAKRELATVESVDINNNEFVGYSPLPKLEGLPDLKWDAIISINANLALKPLQQLLLILIAATGGVGILAAVLGIAIAPPATKPKVTGV